MSGQRTLSLDFREIRPADYERLEQIYNANYPDYLISASELKARDDSIDKTKYLLKRITCSETTTGKIVGFGGIANVLDMYHPRKFMLTIFVDPADQKVGVGTAIFNRLMSELQERHAQLAWVMNREDLTMHRRFFEKRGFHERLREWESRLDVRTYNPELFREYESRMTRQGITFTTLALEKTKGEGSLRKLHELVQLITADMPRQAEFTPLSYDQWRSYSMNSPRLIPQGYFIAKHGEEFVGMSDVLRNEKDPLTLTQDDTGVKRDYRGKGIATGLKLKVIEFAKKNGYETIETRNDSINASMLAVNMKLGFERKVGWILLEKDLTRQN